jgi:hypothetical protein
VPTDARPGDALAALLASLEDAVRTGDRRRIKEAVDNLGRINIEVQCTLPATPRKETPRSNRAGRGPARPRP